MAQAAFRRAKAYYLGPAYPLLWAPGAVVVERLALRPRWGWLREAATVLVVATGLMLAPLAKPILPVETHVTYMDALGVAPSTGIFTITALTTLTFGTGAAILFALEPDQLDLALLRVVFVGLFALTVPHMLLGRPYALTRRWRIPRRRWRAPRC